MRKNKSSVTPFCICCLCLCICFPSASATLSYRTLNFQRLDKNLKCNKQVLLPVYHSFLPQTSLQAFFSLTLTVFAYSYPFIIFPSIPFKIHMHNAVSLQGPYSVRWNWIFLDSVHWKWIFKWYIYSISLKFFILLCLALGFDLFWDSRSHLEKLKRPSHVLLAYISWQLNTEALIRQMGPRLSCWPLKKREWQWCFKTKLFGLPW